MKKLVVYILTRSAKKVLARHKPTIIAVTGSVGKTSTKEAIALVLKTKFSVRSNKKNLNTELGVPLTILGIDQPSSKFGWINACLQALFRSNQETYPTHLVLEFGADRPGDITKLVDLAPPKVGVVTAISHVHVENFPSFEALIEEKSALVKRLPPDGLAVLNGDDDRVHKMKELTQAPVVTYGAGAKAEIVIEKYVLQTREDNSFDPGEVLADVRFDVRDRRTEEAASEIVFKNTVGSHQAMVSGAAVAVGHCFGISTAEAAKALSDGYVSPNGRMKPLYGIKGSLLIDDSYNATPSSMNAALEVFKDFHPVEGARRIAVLGEMAELGAHTEEKHREIGFKAAEVGVDLLVCVGEKTRDIARAAKEAGMLDEQIVLKQNSVEAGRFMDHEIKKGDIVLIKGSQSSRMEKVSKDLLADPSAASKLLVRQEPEWLNR